MASDSMFNSSFNSMLTRSSVLISSSLALKWRGLSDADSQTAVLPSAFRGFSPSVCIFHLSIKVHERKVSAQQNECHLGEMYPSGHNVSSSSALNICSSNTQEDSIPLCLSMLCQTGSRICCSSVSSSVSTLQSQKTITCKVYFSVLISRDAQCGENIILHIHLIKKPQYPYLE